MDSFAPDSSGFLRATDFPRAGRSDRALRRSADRGDLVTILPGVFLPADAWSRLDGRERHVARARALADRLPPTAVFSHTTAAAILGYGRLGSWPALVDVTDTDASRTRRGATTRTHAFPLTGRDVTSVDCLPVTTPGRTAVDVAASQPFRNAVVTIDSALESPTRLDRVAHPLEPREFEAALERRLPVRCHNQIARVRSFVDGRSDSGGESLSRVILSERGWPPPILQHPFSDAEGLIGEVDFWWPEAGVIGEFDGFVTSSRGDDLRGRGPAQAVVDEKRREDRLRAHPHVRGFARWVFDDLSKPGRLDSVLTSAGLRRPGRVAPGRPP